MRVVRRSVLMLPEATYLNHLLILLLVAMHHDGQAPILRGSATSERNGCSCKGLNRGFSEANTVKAGLIELPWGQW